MDHPSRVRRAAGATLLCASVALVVWATLLPGHEIAPQLRPPLWCLRCGSSWLTDVISNVALFVPFGAALALLGWRLRSAFALGVVSTVCIESAQALGVPPGRSAALADLLTNAFGTWLGALVVAQARTLWQPSPVAARWLWLAWSAGAIGVLWGSSVATAPVAPARAAVRYSASPYRHVPKQAYYGGTNDSARVGDTVFTRGYAGPIIVQASAVPHVVDVVSHLRGSELERIAVPIVFVHLPGDSSALLQLRVHGDAAEADVTRRAHEWGLRLPSVRVADAFAGRSLDDPRVLVMRARATQDSVSLAVERHGAMRTAQLAFTPLLGWAFIQPVVEIQDRLAPLAALLWMAFLLMPAMWWAARDRSRVAAVAVAAGMGGALLLLPVITGVAAISSREWVMVVLLLLAAGLGSRATVGSPEDRSA